MAYETRGNVVKQKEIRLREVKASRSGSGKPVGGDRWAGGP